MNYIKSCQNLGVAETCESADDMRKYVIAYVIQKIFLNLVLSKLY